MNGTTVISLGSPSPEAVGPENDQSALEVARVALITLSAFIFSTDFGNRGHSAVIVCSSL